MVAIHHATLARAKRFGWTMEAMDDGFVVVTDKEGNRVGRGMGGKAALSNAEATRGERRMAQAQAKVELAIPPVDDKVHHPRTIAGSVVAKPYRELYKKHDGTNGDWVADLISEHCVTVTQGKRALDRPALEKILRENEVTMPRSGANNGQFRMTAGIKLRSVASKKGYLLVNGRKHFAKK